MGYNTFPEFDYDPEFSNWKDVLSEDNVIKSPMRAGRTKTRARHTYVPRSCTVVYPLLPQVDKRRLELFEIDNRGTRFWWPNFQEAYGADAWVRETLYTVRSLVQPVAPNGHSYICTTEGLSAATEPTWPTTVNEMIADNDIIWMENSQLVRVDGIIDFVTADVIHYWRASFTLVKD